MTGTDMVEPVSAPTRAAPFVAPNPDGARPRPPSSSPHPPSLPGGVVVRRSRRRGRRLAVAAVVIAVVASTAMAVGRAREAGGGEGPRTATVSRHAVSRSVSNVATVAPRSQATVAFPTTGTVDSVDVVVGQAVEAGQVVATLDRTELEATVTERETALVKAELASSQAYTAASTTTTSLPSAALAGGASVATTEPAASSAGAAPTGSGGATSSAGSVAPGSSGTTGSSASVAEAEGAVVDARADLDAARQALDQATLASPIAGTVIAVSLEAGASVTASSTTAVVVVAGTAELEATTTVGIDDIEDVRVGQPATVLPDGRAEPLSGTVSSIAVSPTTSGTTASYGVVVRFDEPVTDLGNGSTATVTIVTASIPDAVAVPLSALRTEGQRHAVTVLDGETLRPTVVSVGVVGDTWAEVTDGLTVGQAVVLADLAEPLPSSATDASGANGIRPAADGGPPMGGGGGPPAIGGAGPPAGAGRAGG